MTQPLLHDDRSAPHPPPRRSAPRRSATPPRSRVTVEVDELGDLPEDALAAVAAVARALLEHGTVHGGDRAQLEVARSGGLLNLWLSDPECSPACVAGAGELPGTHGPRAERIRLATAAGGDDGSGLQLHWALLLSHDEGVPATGPRVQGPVDR